jgi:hypothetical protein
VSPAALTTCSGILDAVPAAPAAPRRRAAAPAAAPARHLAPSAAAFDLPPAVSCSLPSSSTRAYL